MAMATNNTQGSAWELGVAFPLPNWSFQHPSKIVTTVGSAYTSGQSLNLTRSGNNGWQGGRSAPAGTGSMYRHYAASGDLVVIGPSTHVDNIGAVATGTVAVISDVNVVTILESNLTDNEGTTIKFSVGDSVQCIGTNMPAGWVITTFFNNDNGDDITMNGVFSPDSGFDDDQSLSFSKANTDRSMNFSMRPSIVYTTDNDSRYLPRLVQTYVYRMACHVQTQSNSGPALDLNLFETGSNALAVNLDLNNLPIDGTWEEFTGVGTIGDHVNSEDFQFASALIELQIQTTSVTTGFKMDCVVVTHAMGTDDQAAGIYTFDEFPMESSVKFRPRNKMIAHELMNEKRLVHFPGGDRKKWILRARYDAVSKEFLEQLRILDRWQGRGNMLTLKPYIYDLPPYLTGTMRILGGGKDSWDLDKVSFDIEFTEA